jgi:hypothetical protein
VRRAAVGQQSLPGLAVAAFRSNRRVRAAPPRSGIVSGTAPEYLLIEWRNHAVDSMALLMASADYRQTLLVGETEHKIY